MRKRTIGTALAASVLATTTVFGIGTAFAATAPTTLTDQQRHVLSGYHADRMIVDGVRQRLIVADDMAHRILAVRYDGTIAAEVALPDGTNAGDLRLSADSGTLWATVPGAHQIISWKADSLEEIRRYTFGTAYELGDLVLTGGKVWFAVDVNRFGVLDPETGESTAFVLGQGNNSSASAKPPLMAVNPKDPTRLALTDTSTRGDLFLYDISGATPALVAQTQTGYVSGHTAVGFTADGYDIFVTGYNGVYETSAGTLSGGTTISTDAGADVESSAASWVAVGMNPSAERTDLRLFPPTGETVPSREFDFPISGAAPVLTDLAWEPGADRLFAITTDAAGAQSLWTIDKASVIPAPPAPVQTATSITLKAPATAGRGSGINVTGTLAGGLPMGTPVKVVRTDAETPAGVTVKASDTNASGAFSFLDFPQAGGTIGYTVSYAGDATHKASSAKVSVSVAKTTPALTLNRNGTVNAYNATVTMTARLGATYKNRTVEIWADPYGADQAKRLLKKGTVNGSGDLSVSFKLTRDTTFSAVFAGDTRYAARTVTSTLRTKVAVSTAVTKHYKVKKSYYYVRKRTNPKFTTTMTAYPNRKQQLVFEKFSGGKWVAWKSGTYKLSTAGKYTYTLTGTHSTGVKYRVRAVYVTGTSGDSANYTTYGSWRYFRFTS
ncbi:hypothetical protein ACTI_25630 [Actinoplanes sp. OR16]|uniref:Ig-like domain repeat protein n=1 Tax=Actinoplanes sp. OR16 TaxID=946334 RepID=UPI000F6C8804|nr:Ig-like domain repeat protein [Actinoplanes sp. OR16]BBH65878.1 hypothetical protein ACTI_25630 [Actinoplanes sp. OR16]